MDQRNSEGLQGLNPELISTSAYWRVDIRDEVESTQSEFKLSASSDDNFEGQVIVAEYQSKGRGRLDRSFESEKYLALTFSFLLKPLRSQEEWSWLPLLIGSSVVEAINQILQNGSERSQVLTKWPNDIVTSDGLKMGGILVEQRDSYLIAGIGLNVHHRREQLPVPHAISLDLFSNRRNKRELILSEILKKIEERYLLWNSLGMTDVEKNKYQESSLTLGRSVLAQLPGGKQISGVAIGIDPNGSLLIQTVEKIEKVSAGDVIHAFGNTQIR
ncbi:MAG: biotin--[acetyl-CoA-carboxylase] ligase [Actinobacteria bacterium]|nr:biotin--[acetyl-CoA-carboxylase] ligase [Actinomycetota bacterium]